MHTSILEYPRYTKVAIGCLVENVDYNWLQMSMCWAWLLYCETGIILNFVWTQPNNRDFSNFLLIFFFTQLGQDGSSIFLSVFHLKTHTTFQEEDVAKKKLEKNTRIYTVKKKLNYLYWGWKTYFFLINNTWVLVRDKSIIFFFL